MLQTFIKSSQNFQVAKLSCSTLISSANPYWTVDSVNQKPHAGQADHLQYVLKIP